MTKKTYSELLKDPRWQRKRLEILNRDNFKCVRCGDTETTLHVHHAMYFGKPWECPDVYLETVCEDCHELEHLNLTDLERLLLSCLLNRDQGDVFMCKMSVRVVKSFVLKRNG